MSVGEPRRIYTGSALGVPSFIHQALSSAAFKGLENLVEKSGGLIDTRLPTNLARGRFFR